MRFIFSLAAAVVENDAFLVVGEFAVVENEAIRQHCEPDDDQKVGQRPGRILEPSVPPEALATLELGRKAIICSVRAFAFQTNL